MLVIRVPWPRVWVATSIARRTETSARIFNGTEPKCLFINGMTNMRCHETRTPPKGDYKHLRRIAQYEWLWHLESKTVLRFIRYVVFRSVVVAKSRTNPVLFVFVFRYKQTISPWILQPQIVFSQYGICILPEGHIYYTLKCARSKKHAYPANMSVDEVLDLTLFFYSMV